MIKLVVWMTLLIGLCSCSSTEKIDSLTAIFNNLDMDIFMEAAQKVAFAKGLSVDIRKQMETDIQYLATQGAACLTCRTAMSTAKTIIRNGATFEDIQDQAISICVSVTAGMGYDGEIMCAGIINNFGPEVVYVLDVTDDIYSASDICSYYRLCQGRRQLTKAPVKAVAAKTKHLHKQTRDYSKLLRLVHVTDIHVDQDYRPGAPSYCNLPLCCREGQTGSGDSAHWGDYQCGVPTHTVEAFLKQLAEYDPQIITYTGDSPPHAIWLETQWGQIDDSHYITEVLSQVFPDIPSYTSLGNHDTYPVNMYGRNRPEKLTEELNEALAGYWGPLSRFEAEQYDTFEYGGYYSILAQPGLRVVSYNSNYGTTENFFWLIPLQSGEIYEMFSYIESELEQARANNEKVVLLGHHPTGSKGYFELWESFMYDITNRYGDIIMLHFVGHVHSDNIKMTYDRDTGSARNVWLSTGSMVSKTNINPSAKIFYLDPVTFEPIDFDTVFFNFSANIADPEVSPKLELMYRASEEYGLVDLSPESWADLLERMNTDDELFYRYQYNEGTRTQVPETCEGSCRHEALCAIKNVVASDYDDCVNSYKG